MKAPATNVPSAWIDAFGHVIEVTCRGPEAPALHESILAAWSRCLAEPDAHAPVGTSIEVGVDPGAAQRSHGGVVRARTTSAALELLTQAITLEAISRSRGELLMLHAGALADPRSGAAVVMVGPSGVGKSTAMRRHGGRWGYVTDETVAIDDGGAIRAYPKPLSLHTGGLVKDQISPDALALGPTPSAPRASALLLLDRRPGLDLTVEELDLATSIARLAEHTSYLTLLQQPLQRIARLVGSAGCALVSYGDTDQLGAVIDDLLGVAR